MTTATKLTPAELLEQLHDLLDAATRYAAAEAEMDRLGEQIMTRQDDWLAGLDGRYTGAVFGEVRAALTWGERERDGLQECQDIQDAIDVLKFAMERDGGC